jgi:hypothetical protein
MEAIEKPPPAFAFVYKISIVGFTSRANERKNDDDKKMACEKTDSLDVIADVCPKGRIGPFTVSGIGKRHPRYGTEDFARRERHTAAL